MNARVITILNKGLPTAWRTAEPWGFWWVVMLMVIQVPRFSSVKKPQSRVTAAHMNWAAIFAAHHSYKGPVYPFARAVSSENHHLGML